MTSGPLQILKEALAYKKEGLERTEVSIADTIDVLRHQQERRAKIVLEIIELEDFITGTELRQQVEAESDENGS